MKFCVPSKTFYNYASAVNKVINSKNALTVLNNFLMTLEGDTVTLTGSDVENQLTARIPVTDAQGSGSVCVDARRMVELLKEIPDQGLTVEVDSNYKVRISYSNGGCEFVAIDGIEFPAAKRDEEDTAEPVSFTCPSKVLSRGIENTLFAATTDDYRPVMMGVFFDIKPDGITFVATDTRKLVKYTDNNCQPNVTATCVVPPKPANILRSVFAGEEDVKLTLTRKSATIENGSFVFNCRFLQGNFPDYNRVIPRNNTLVLTVDRLAMLNAVRRVGLFVSLEYGLEKFKITPDNLEINSEDNNLLTAARESLPCSFTGEQLVIGFGAPYLLEMLNTLKTTDITISLSDPGRPGLFRPTEDEPNTELVMLLMPMTVGEY